MSNGYRFVIFRLRISEEESLLFPFTIVKVKRRPPNKLTYGQVCRDLTDVKTHRTMNVEGG